MLWRSVLALMASEGIFPVNLVTSLFRAATAGNRFSSRSQEAACPGRPIPAFNGLGECHPDVFCQQLVHRIHELAPRVNLQEFGPLLVNPSQAIGELCRSLASQGLIVA